MKKRLFTLVLTIIALLCLSTYVTDRAHSKTPTMFVVELFTSQNCPACPPADALLHAISRHPNIVALDFHVDYWDRKNRKDPLSQDFASTRQRSYARAQDNQVYTPQMYVNGTTAFNGADQPKLEATLRQSSQVALIGMSTMHQKLKLNLPSVDIGSYVIRIYGIQSRYNQTITAGQNRGKIAPHGNVVVSESKTSSWRGGKKTTFAPIPKGKRIDKVIAIVQKKNFGEIVAVGQLKL